MLLQHSKPGLMSATDTAGGVCLNVVNEQHTVHMQLSLVQVFIQPINMLRKTF